MPTKSAPQIKQRSLPLSANMMMASTGFTKGIPLLLLLGLLLPSALVSGQATTTAPTTTSIPPITTTAGGATTTSIPPTTTTSGGATTTSIPPTTTTSGGATTTSIPPITTTSGGATTTSIPPTTTMPGGSTIKPTWSTNSSSLSPTTGSTMNSTSMSMISCPSFTCNYSDCCNMYNSQNATSCSAGLMYCQLIRQSDICYTASCSASCAATCNNASQTNCSVECCNTTGCLNSTFASMMMTTTPPPTTTTTTVSTAATETVTTAATTVPQTTVDNSNKCFVGVCSDNLNCYTVFIAAQIQSCTSTQTHCQLKKETVGGMVQWTAGCTTNCSSKPACTSTATPCHQECCEATQTSCLWLNGTLNVPSFATRGQHLNTELIALIVYFLGLSLLM